LSGLNQHLELDRSKAAKGVLASAGRR
jgi:hypothetical protein